MVSAVIKLYTAPNSTGCTWLMRSPNNILLLTVQAVPSWCSYCGQQKCVSNMICTDRVQHVLYIPEHPLQMLVKMFFYLMKIPPASMERMACGLSWCSIATRLPAGLAMSRTSAENCPPTSPVISLVLLYPHTPGDGHMEHWGRHM